MPVTFAVQGPRALPSGGSFSAWDATVNSSLLTFSNGNRTALRNGASAGTVALARGAASHSSGKQFFEQTIVAAANRVCSGFCNSSADLNSNLGVDGNSVEVLSDFTRIQLNGASISGNVFSNLVAGDVLTWAIDFTAELCWLRKNATGNWNDVVGADPATGTSGVDFSAANAGPWFIAQASTDAGDGTTINVGASAFTDTVPSGFSAWG